MATKVYEENIIELIDGTKISVSPSKIKYLRQILDNFENINKDTTEDEAISIMVECVRIAMKQFYPSISETTDQIEDNLDIKTVYKVLEYCAGIKINTEKQESVGDQAKSESSGSTWKDLDLAKLESEVLLIGAWKNYEDLEMSICMPELILILENKRELDYADKKFAAAMQGVDLEENNKKDAWQEMKERILYKGKDENDIVNLKGAKAKKAGFGIGHGLEYEEITI